MRLKKMNSAWDPMENGDYQRLRCDSCDNLDMLVIYEGVRRYAGKHKKRVVAKCKLCGRIERLSLGAH